MKRDALDMITVEALHPTTRKKFGETSVALSTSGLIVWLFDENDHGIAIHRYAWDGVAKAVAELFAEEKRQAQEYVVSLEDDTQ